MEQYLARFAGDKNAVEAVKLYFDEVLGREAVRMVFDRKDVSHIADAKILIDKAFEQLEINYGIPSPEKTATNPAR